MVPTLVIGRERDDILLARECARRSLRLLCDDSLDIPTFQVPSGKIGTRLQCECVMDHLLLCGFCMRGI